MCFQVYGWELVCDKTLNGLGDKLLHEKSKACTRTDQCAEPVHTKHNARCFHKLKFLPPRKGGNGRAGRVGCSECSVENNTIHYKRIFFAGVLLRLMCPPTTPLLPTVPHLKPREQQKQQKLNPRCHDSTSRGCVLFVTGVSSTTTLPFGPVFVFIYFP